MNSFQETIYLGNDAIARGMLESGCGFLYSYPGTPASEILPGFVSQADKEGVRVYGQWVVNEKIALESALTIAATGMRSAAVMKQVGLNVAADPLMSGAYLGVDGGLVVVSADDPGPYSSQTEQDSRFFAMLAKIPVFDPASPDDARLMTARAFALSEQHSLPVMLRPTATLCHARQNMVPAPLLHTDQTPCFSKNPHRWAATPRHRFVLHQQLNQKLAAIGHDPQFSFSCAPRGNQRLAIIASGFAWSLAADIIDAHPDLQAQITLVKVDLPFPLHQPSIDAMLADYRRILVLEETYPVIELQLGRREQVGGRLDHAVPDAGELTPDLVKSIIYSQLEQKPPAPPRTRQKTIPRRPRLCPGCPHRSSFYALKTALKNGIYAGDVGCYTLGLNLKALDTCLCMGASITQASTLYQAYATRSDAPVPPIAAIIGDSTFFHSGIPALVNARMEDSRFVLLLLDNETTAMTGNQPTPASGLRANGSQGPKLPLEEIIRGCGISRIQVVDAYEQQLLQKELVAAWNYAIHPEGAIAVIIARHPCMMDPEARRSARRATVVVSDDCTACGTCIEEYECPALIADQTGTVRVDPVTCVGCGLCIDICPFGAIIATGNGQDR
ncbi:MAG: 4Fe-4S binding protein [Deltaproteobacteria bacterium]|nr:4Fe-4S binding protein [Candidatus Anaeroferrophillus wilburensis]